jgi:hypothetical protein
MLTDTGNDGVGVHHLRFSLPSDAGTIDPRADGVHPRASRWYLLSAPRSAGVQEACAGRARCGTSAFA